MAKEATKKVTTKKKVNRITENGKVYITATFNNTLVTFTNNKGDTIVRIVTGKQIGRAHV